ncbi:MAG: Type IV pilus assembly protein PilM [Candidatus Woesebacteria bacterium GW2011_GWA1_45_8]|uniref:Type IV pilus assembly protein PilM n=1 Tax=Candidatus Woesebacteria bacterium GW2011_GWA1_45_8 TaxID=1618559 RepID=A0A0G1MVT8_9BACT|nr:MAG: Type IV pilus assembly protein PilM [Candidatus Woesebacteria bacterium GW2011_GWA1_45_8]
MAAKSFVSIYFSPSKLQVVKLGASKKRVEKFATVDLPEGLVMGYGVGNIKALSEIIKKTFSQLGLREKSVGLVVPEFSSFIKSIKLPKLGQEDLDEAVRWQAQDFLPGAAGEMIMDWKIVRESPHEYQILAAAIRKEILAGFVDAVEEAGLLPLLVETPSLALVRLSGPSASGRLIVYVNFKEAVLVVSEGAKILGSSVVNLAEGADIASTAAAAMRHYKDVQVEKVLIGGSDITSELQAKLQKDLGKPIEALKAAVSGLSAQDIQKYLIPYSLQLSPSLGPEEETTINLLPPKWVRKYLNKKLKLQILSLLLISSLFIWGCLLAAGTVYFYLVGEQKTLAENPAISSADPPQELSKRVEGVNNVAKRTEAILAASKYPQDVLNAIFAARPANVVIETYLIDMETGKVSLSGIAADRRSLVDFKDALEKNKAFSLIQVPVSSFEAETNLEYVVNFIYLPATPKKATPTPQPK